MSRYDAMLVTPFGTEGKSKWVKIGAAFVNQDGSISLKLDAYPAPGSDLVLQIPMTKEEKDAKFGTHGQAMRQQSSPQRMSPGQGRGYQPPPGRGHQQQRAPMRAPAPWVLEDGTEVYEAKDLPTDHPDFIPFD